MERNLQNISIGCVYKKKKKVSIHLYALKGDETGFCHTIKLQKRLMF